MHPIECNGKVVLDACHTKHHCDVSGPPMKLSNFHILIVPDSILLILVKNKRKPTTTYVRW